MVHVFSENDKVRLKGTVASAVTIMNDIRDLRESLKELKDSVVEELEIDKKALNLAIKYAFLLAQSQNPVEEHRTKFDEAEELLLNAGLI